MSTRAELEATLATLGTEPAPGPRADFVAALEDRLRLAALGEVIAVPDEPTPPANVVAIRRIYGMPVGAVAATVFAVLGLAIAGVADTQLATPAASPARSQTTPHATTADAGAIA